MSRHLSVRVIGTLVVMVSATALMHAGPASAAQHDMETGKPASNPQAMRPTKTGPADRFRISARLSTTQASIASDDGRYAIKAGLTTTAACLADAVFSDGFELP